MEKKYQVFVSSTYKDLTEERKEVIQALLELDCIPVGMELFPAADDDQWTLIKRLIEDCDCYVLIIGGRYGSLNKEGISYTQMEYEYAISQNIPTIAFLHKNPDKIELGKSEREQGQIDKLQKFKAKVQEKMCRYWETPSELGSQVSRSLVKLIKDKPRVGWVKASLLPSEEVTRQILELKRQNELLQEEIRTTKDNAPKGTENLSQGNDEITLKYYFSAFSTSNDWIIDVEAKVKTYSSSFGTTWNDLFTEISPLMIDEANEPALKSKLDACCADVNLDKHKELLKEFSRIGSFHIDDNDFHKIKIQLRALKLITKSEKKRSIKDNETYWQHRMGTRL